MFVVFGYGIRCITLFGEQGYIWVLESIVGPNYISMPHP